MSVPPHKPNGNTPEARAAAKAERRGRAARRRAFVEQRAGHYDLRALNDALAERLERDRARATRAPEGALRAFPSSDVRRWVPIGPSVVRRGQATGNPRVSGRIRDLAVSTDGRRAYAASAKGGVWYTDDAGSTWSPVGGWAERSAERGGNNNAQACGCLLVHFGGSAADDYVMVGTGELIPSAHQFVPQHGGLGVLAARGPATQSAGAAPWEAEAGLASFEGLGFFRLAGHPNNFAAGASEPVVGDEVLAATSAGLFLGRRVAATASDPAHWVWTELVAVLTLPLLLVAAHGHPVVTDVLWFDTGTADGRIVIALDTNGVAFSDDRGANWSWLSGLDPGSIAQPITGRLSLAHATAGRLYVLGEVLNNAGNPVPTLWQIADVTAAAPAATTIAGLPSTDQLWGNQRDYDQALAVDPDGAVDHLYVGGSTIMPTNAANAEWSASLWCFDLPVPGAGPLVPAPGISTTGAPSAANPTAAGADQPGLIGNNVHADVHAIRLAGPSGATRQVWVACDGGVFLSSQRGRCNTFLSRVTGLAVLEVGFVAQHPTSSHFVAIGCQDAGAQARQGDTVWEMILPGDGGGTLFHPIASQYIISQWTRASWPSRPRAGYIDPVSRGTGGAFAGPADAREDGLSAFYSGCASVALSPTVGRIAIGTNRVWISDDLDGSGNNTWRVIGFPNGAARDARPGGTDPVSRRGWGVPLTAANATIGAVIQLRWASPRDLLAVYEQGLVRYLQDPATGDWTATVLIPDLAGSPNPANTTFTDVCPVPGTSDFYLTSTGDTNSPPGETCWYFEAATSTFHPTGLRHALDRPGTPPVLGPLDPAYAVAVDPAVPTDVYVGTVTGVWRAQRTAGTTTHGPWRLFDNGLPQAAVQDLAIWTDPSGAAESPRLLRAAVQSRGVWEVNLAANEAQRTYARVHLRDDRRRLPTPLANPRRAPGTPDEPVYASPDLTLRPAANPTTAPRWSLGGGTINAHNAPRYELWTFQTAFRWLYPSIHADGLWTDQLGDLIVLHRRTLNMDPVRTINRPLWDAVVGGTRLDPSGAVSTAPGDPLAVYRAPWQSPAALDAVATEADLIELVAPVSATHDIWRVYREPCTVDVLVHHRDTRALPPGDAFAVLLWRSDPSAAALLATSAADLQAYVQSLVTDTPLAAPAGWTIVPLPSGPPTAPPLHRLPVQLDARLPRAIPIDLDLSAVPHGHHVLLLACVGSTADPFTAAPSGPTATVPELVRAWPHTCLRLLRVLNRP